MDFADTIDSGLIRIANAIPDNPVELSELEEAIRFNGEEIRRRLEGVASVIARLARCFEKE